MPKNIALALYAIRKPATSGDCWSYFMFRHKNSEFEWTLRFKDNCVSHDAFLARDYLQRLQKIHSDVELIKIEALPVNGNF